MTPELLMASTNGQSLTVEEIRHLTARKRRPEETLADIVRLIHQRFAVPVCSIYLIEPDRTIAGV